MTNTPNDHKSKNFTFDYNGKTYTFEKPFSVVSSPRWLRANRRRDELDLAFTILEDVAGDEFMTEVVDNMTEAEFMELSKTITKEMGASLGE